MQEGVSIIIEKDKGLQISKYAFYKPRKCRLLTCRGEFIPKRIDQKFCCVEHRLIYHSRIREIGKNAMEIMK